MTKNEVVALAVTLRTVKKLFLNLTEKRGFRKEKALKIISSTASSFVKSFSSKSDG